MGCGPRYIHGSCPAGPVYTYVGHAQIVNERKNLAASYARVLELARAAGDEEAVTALTTIGPPPWDSLRKWPVYRKQEVKYQAKLVTAPEPPFTISPAYASPEERTQWHEADDFGFMHFYGMNLSGEMMQVDLPALGTEFAVPIFMIQGEQILSPPSLSLPKRISTALKRLASNSIWCQVPATKCQPLSWI